ncbi:MAG TPA: Gfo/Idh/MocA family oxidoreductase [Firmicutes bacterium]|nr:Gfo/Idh/MocA family oxidoreductase [Bacillota bacterium]
MRIGLIGASGHYAAVLKILAEEMQGSGSNQSEAGRSPAGRSGRRGHSGPAYLAAIAMTHETEKAKIESVRRHPAYLKGKTVEYDSAQTMLAQADLDAVIVNPPYGWTASYILQALERGIAVYSEKPLATKLADLELIQKKAHQTATPLVAMFELRAHPVTATAARLVAEGAIGRPVLAFGQKSYKLNPDGRPIWYADRELFGGTIPWVAIHAIDWTRFITGLEFAQVYASEISVAAGRLAPIATAGAIHFTFRQGGTAAITFDYLRPAEAETHGDDRFRIAGTEGVLEGSLPRNELLLIRRGQGTIQPPLDETKPLFRRFLDALYGKTLHGKAEMPMTADDAIASTRAALWAQKAADEGSLLDIAEGKDVVG